MDHIRNCIVCKRRLYSAQPDVDKFESPIDGGIYLRSYGNYGSSIHDPCGRKPEQLEIYICDFCLRQKSDFIYSFNEVCGKATDIHPFTEDLYKCGKL